MPVQRRALSLVTAVAVVLLLVTLTAPTPARAAAATTTPGIVHLDHVRLPQTRIVDAAARP
jgi:hypothetical protein